MGPTRAVMTSQAAAPQPAGCPAAAGRRKGADAFLREGPLRAAIDLLPTAEPCRRDATVTDAGDDGGG
jgi:hypothetical protein